ncbi:MAG: HD domain-containing protein [Ginsengibacter sp.]
MTYDILAGDMASYLISLYKQYETAILLYHNLDHTQTVIKRTNEIAANYSLNDEEKFVLLAAAWFHDTGHLFGEAKDHEERSAFIMREYLEAKEVEIKVIDLIGGCIRATKLPQSPGTLLEDIICDADIYNLGTEDFFRTDKLLKREFELRNNTSLDDWSWDEKTSDLLEDHQYFTHYCQATLEKGRQKNIEIIHTLLVKSNDSQPGAQNAPSSLNKNSISI